MKAAPEAALINCPTGSSRIRQLRTVCALADTVGVVDPNGESKLCWAPGYSISWASWPLARKRSTKALQGGNHLTRAEIAKLYQEASIIADELRLAYLVMHAELEGLI